MPDSMEQVYEILTDYERRLRYLEAIDTTGALTDHNHTGAGGDGGILTGDEHDSFSEYAEIGSPANPAANKLRMFAKDIGGNSRLHMRDSAPVEFQLAGGGEGDVHTVDTIHAAAAPAANILLALNGASIFPADCVDWGTLTLDAQVWMGSWYNAVAWVLANNIIWQSDTQSTIITPRRKSTVVVIGMVTWQDSTATRAVFMDFRWNLNAVAGQNNGPFGNQAARREGHTLIGVFTAVPAGARTLMLQAQKTNVVFQADAVTIATRYTAIFVLPED